MRHTLSVLLFCCVVACAAAEAPIIRDPGVIYFSDLKLQPVDLKLIKPSTCYLDLDSKRPAGTLRFPQTVKLEAIAANGLFRIRGNALQGGVVAWAAPQFFDPLPEKFVENLRKSDERRQKVDALISRNEVAIGMTPDEVFRSLGKPQKKSSRANKEGTQQIWEYIKYEIVPQTTYVPVYNQTTVQYTQLPIQRGQIPVPNNQIPIPRNQIPVQNVQPFIQNGQVAIQNLRRRDNLPAPTVVQSSVGGYAPTTIYVKVPCGTLSVSFKDNLVEALDQSEGTSAGGQVSVVIPPVNVYW